MLGLRLAQLRCTLLASQFLGFLGGLDNHRALHFAFGLGNSARLFYAHRNRPLNNRPKRLHSLNFDRDLCMVLFFVLEFLFALVLRLGWLGCCRARHVVESCVEGCHLCL